MNMYEKRLFITVYPLCIRMEIGLLDPCTQIYIFKLVVHYPCVSLLARLGLLSGEVSIGCLMLNFVAASPHSFASSRSVYPCAAQLVPLTLTYVTFTHFP